MKTGKWMMVGLLAVASSAVLATGAFAKETENDGAYVAPPMGVLGKANPTVQSQPTVQTTTTVQAAPAVHFFAPIESGVSDK
ncbi:hypothetical protein NDK47_19355 [Brevibacillus ruminantium]|uniref:Uncharacterized protein n=1 Tax=Brevibacillus ruminantium TaxID=2950604 RepID=A0ABY4WDU3_9BACL|nr:hypothetical protein [Brevibacillus ruminantium]USG64298.1 hypothetical protein NDK47_19355 [Brevibacillus ruminantium]